MLSDRAKRLLARAVDGGLDKRQQRAVKHLLRESDEARKLFQRLQQDAQRLRALPRKQLPAQFATDVLQAIGTAQRPVPASVAASAQRYLPLWANFAAALTVLLAVSIGTYLVVTISDQQKAAQLAAVKNPEPETPFRPDTNTDDVVISRPSRLQGPERPEPLPPPRPEEEDVAGIELPEPEEPESKTVLTVPFNPKLELFKVEMPKLPPILPVRELDQAAHRAMLLDSLKGEEGYHLDLFCEDANRAFERVQKILRSQGKPVVVEALARRRLHARLKTNYVIYTESLSASDAARLFAALAAEERRGESPLVEKLVVAPLSPISQKTLAALLGIDVKQLNLKSKSAANSPTRPLSDSTADALARALADKERPGNGRLSDASILALSYNPIRPNPSLSREVREFLANRKERRPGYPALMLVIRNLD